VLLNVEEQRYLRHRTHYFHRPWGECSKNTSEEASDKDMIYLFAFTLRFRLRSTISRTNNIYPLITLRNTHLYIMKVSISSKRMRRITAALAFILAILCYFGIFYEPVSTNKIVPISTLTDTASLPVAKSVPIAEQIPSLLNIIEQIPSKQVPLYTPLINSAPAYPDKCKQFFIPSYTNVTIQPSEDLFPSVAPQSKIPDIIHFLSYNSDLRTARYICSLESALHHNPNHLVYLYTPDPEELTRELSKWKGAMGRNDANLKIVKMDYSAVFQGTPMETWYNKGLYKKSHWVSQNLYVFNVFDYLEEMHFGWLYCLRLEERTST
jgi:hypothetical protein